MNLPLESRRAFLQTTLQTTVAGGLLASLPVSALWAEDRQPPKKPKFSCSTINFTSLPLDQACERIAALQFDAVDIWGYLGCQHLKEVADHLKAEGLKALLERHHLKLGSVTVYGATYPPYAKLIGECGGSIVVRGSRRRRKDNVTEDMKDFLEELKPELALCEEHDSYLAIENHSGGDLLDRTDTIKAFVDQNQHKRLGIALAPYHLMHHRESVADAIRICGKQLLFIYFWTNEAEEKQMPGIGQTDVSGWVRALKEIEYAHFITPFMHHEPAPDRMAELHRTTRQYLDQTLETVFSQ